MKFDNFMNFCFKGLCLVLACIIVGGFCVSCLHTPVKAYAWEPGQDPVYWAQQAKDFQEQLEHEISGHQRDVPTGTEFSVHLQNSTKDRPCQEFENV